MPILKVTIFRSKSDPDTLAVSPDTSGHVLPNPEEWEFVRSGTIRPLEARAGSETGRWLLAFEKEGYCLLQEDPAGGECADIRDTRSNTK